MSFGQEVRRRAGGSSSPPSTNERIVDVGLAAPKMLRASPQHHGHVTKLHVSRLYLLLPRFLQRLISGMWFLSFLAPRWERRYLILLGSYLYRFQNESSSSLSGSPVLLNGAEVDIVSKESLVGHDFEVAVPLETVPSGTMCVFVVTTARKKHYYAAPYREMARMWVTSIRQARQEAITRSMGHADPDSYPVAWEQFDRLGESESIRKDRIRSKLQELELRELEMSSLNDGGPLPRGYYG